MKIVKFIAIGLILIIIFISLFIFIYLETTKPQLSGELTLTGLKEKVEVLYDDYGVPHIYAQNNEDAYFALGYVHAQDRLFQMEMIRRVSSGRLAEILGPDQLHVDKLFRTLGISEFAKAHAEKFVKNDSSTCVKEAQAYIAGINKYIEIGKTPIEFIIIGIPKQKFSIEDAYLAGGFMSFGFAEGLRADPILQKIKSELGQEYLNQFYLHSPSDAERIKNHFPAAKNSNELISSIANALNDIPIPLWQGSNGWVVSGSKSKSGFPILANDTHIGFGQPAVWYEAHIEYPGYSFYGHHVAGIPFGLLGNNRKTGWGLTMFENDDVDFFLETLNPEDSMQVKFKDEWKPITVRKEIIKVKGEEDVILEIKSTHHGPILNGISKDIPSSLPPVSMYWSLTQLPNQFLEAVYKINQSQSLEETAEAAAMFTAPGLNIMYGDVEGNIAWWAVARLPIRPEHVNSKIFLDGSSGNDEYLGYYPFEKNPQSVNPPWGYVYSTNNQPDSVDGVLYPGYYYPKARAGRIVDFLNREKKWSPDDMKAMNLDVLSITAPEVAKEISSILKSLQKAEFNGFIHHLDSWDGDHQLDDVAPSIYYSLLSNIIFLSMEDELGNEALKSLCNTSIMKSSYLKLIQNEGSPWWDNRNTSEIETRTQIVEQAATNSLNMLREEFGDKPENWTWNKMHTLTHKHPLGAVKPLDRVFNVGPFQVPGGIEVLNNLMFTLDPKGRYSVISGPALRKITDFSDIENGITVSPTGQSGNLMSPHYDDQAEMFVKGEFRKMLMNRGEIEKVSSNKLILLPSN